MADSVYKLIELVGTSSESWEKAATNAVTPRVTVRDSDGELGGEQGEAGPRPGHAQLPVAAASHPPPPHAGAPDDHPRARL